MISSAPFMPQPQPVIDGFEFASAGSNLQGVWPISDFPRLRDMLAAHEGEVSYEVDGLRDARGRPSLRVKVRGMLRLRCQRCLEVLPLEVEADETLVLASTQAEIDAEPADVNSPDRVVGGKEMPVRDLLEDELILTLPYAPRHEVCRARGAEDAAAKSSPFAGLRGLMRGKH